MTLWTKTLPRASIGEAQTFRDKRDEEIDALEARLDAMTEAERRALVKMGGLAKARIRLSENEALSLWASEFAEHFKASVLELGEADDALAAIETDAFRKRVEGEASVIRQALNVFDAPKPILDIGKLVEAWKRLKQPTAHSAKKMALYAQRFEAVLGARGVDSVTDEDARRFRDWLQTQPFKASGDKHLSSMKVLWKLGRKEGILTGANPFIEVEAVKQPRREKRRRLYDNEADALLSALQNEDVQFSLAMRMLFWHGARGKEVLNLTGTNIETIEGVTCWVVRVNKGKNDPSDRIVPLHSKVRDEVLALAKSVGPGPLFDSFPQWRDGRQGAFQKRASKFIRDVVGIKDKTVVTHGLRYYWVHLADNVLMPPNVQRAISGHAPIGDVHGRVYSTPPNVRVLKEWLDKIEMTSEIAHAMATGSHAVVSQ